ncbi:hypothetical protein GOB94_08680 [Granulicella sp. 5B5]|uniref:hypothetical protein n=1 Tax=Granulicella sp. 5B5 TaxID=1617967 RepID=UPI0015F3BBEF|nr:hypothetical protein [Granulicella sp. 5B5]QMV18749.1 hypothetical protein GOB94_08680 [Granulicella sp. 5B5]
MSPLDWFTSDHFTQDDLIAYHLHDLSPRRARRLRRALASNTALAAESAAILATLEAFPRDEPTPALDTAGLDRYWAALRPHLAVQVAPPATTLPQLHAGWIRPLLLATGVTAFTSVGIVLASLHWKHQQQDTMAEAPPRPALIIAPRTRPAFPDSGHTVAHILPSLTNERPTAPLPVLHAQLEPLLGGSWIGPQSPMTAASLPPAESLPIAVSPPVPSSTTSNTFPVSPAASTTLSTAQNVKHHNHREDLTLGIFGNLIAGRSWNTASTVTTGNDFHAQGATPAVGALASFHQQFSPLFGYRITGAYSRPTLSYSYQAAASTAAQPGSSTITTQILEFSGTYTVLGPHTHRLHTSAEAGGGLLIFHPAEPGTSINSVARPVAIAGVGAELAITQHLGLRAQYRALVFETPDFHDPSFPVPITTSVVLSSQPSIGITYHLGKSHSD